MKDISKLSIAAKMEIAEILKEDNLKIVNGRIKDVKVKKSFYTKYGKRILDFIFALFALLITMPINLLIALATLIDVGSPILFKQQRVGKDGKIFYIYKFRNMTNEVDDNGELLPATQRVTKWGKFVRKTSLDELLNFWSILNGSMSIIGPRPLLDYYLHRFNDHHKMRCAVRPGLECPSLKPLDHIMSWEERFDNDIWYVENCTLLLDIKLLFRIVQIALDKKSIAQRSAADNGGFLGYDINGKVICTKLVPDKYVNEYCLKHGYKDLEDAFAERGHVKEGSSKKIKHIEIAV